MPKCTKCGKWTQDAECKYVGHNKMCAVCGTCPDCLSYEKDLQRYEHMVKDPDYFFEPYDWSDYPGSDRPRKSVERLTVFPDTRYHKVKRIAVNRSETAVTNLISVHVTFEVLTSEQIASHAYLAGGKCDLEVTFDVILDQPKFIISFSKPWNEFFRNQYTSDSLRDFEEKIIALAEGSHKVIDTKVMDSKGEEI